MATGSNEKKRALILRPEHAEKFFGFQDSDGSSKQKTLELRSCFCRCMQPGQRFYIAASQQGRNLYNVSVFKVLGSLTFIANDKIDHADVASRYDEHCCSQKDYDELRKKWNKEFCVGWKVSGADRFSSPKWLHSKGQETWILFKDEELYGDKNDIKPSNSFGSGLRRPAVSREIECQNVISPETSGHTLNHSDDPHSQTSQEEPWVQLTQELEKFMGEETEICEPSQVPTTLQNDESAPSNQFPEARTNEDDKGISSSCQLPGIANEEPMEPPTSMQTASLEENKDDNQTSSPNQMAGAAEKGQLPSLQEVASPAEQQKMEPFGPLLVEKEEQEIAEPCQKAVAQGQPKVPPNPLEPSSSSHALFKSIRASRVSTQRETHAQNFDSAPPPKKRMVAKQNSDA